MKLSDMMKPSRPFLTPFDGKSIAIRVQCRHQAIHQLSPSANSGTLRQVVKQASRPPPRWGEGRDETNGERGGMKRMGRTFIPFKLRQVPP